MILRRYLVKEIFKAQTAILFVLLVIFISQKLIRILSNAINGDVPLNLIFSLLMLGLSEMFNLILPLSLFLGILIALVRLYNDSEMNVMYACGMQKKVIFQAVSILVILTCLLTFFNVSVYGPWSGKEEDLMLQNAKANPTATGLLSGQFQILEESNSVIYVGESYKNQLSNIFIYQNATPTNPKSSIMLANEGKVTLDKKGNQIIQLKEANRYEGATIANEFRISNFKDYQAIIIPKLVDDVSDLDEKKMTFDDLFLQQTPQAKAELWWRFTLLFSVPLLAFLVIPISVSNPRNGKFGQILPAILLYLIYFLAISSFKANGAKGKLDPAFWMIFINLIYLALAILFNLWDTAWMRKIRYRIKLRSIHSE